MSPFSYGCLFFCTAFTAPVFSADYNVRDQSDFNNFSGLTYKAGDRILFERGESFEGQFVVRNSSGTRNNPIQLIPVGQGSMPRIDNEGAIHTHPTRSSETTSSAILLMNSEGIVIDGLELTNDGGIQEDLDSHGILVLGEDLGRRLNYFRFENNYIHHVNEQTSSDERGGIFFHGNSPDSSNASSFEDIQIRNNRISRVGGIGISTSLSKSDLEHGDDIPLDQPRENAILGLLIEDNEIDRTGRNGIRARDADDALVQYNTISNSSRYKTGHSILGFNTRGLVIQYNEIYGNIGDADDTDRGAIVSGFNSQGSTIQYNYMHNNHWGVGIMRKNNNDLVVRFNINVNNLYGAYHYGFPGHDDLRDAHVYNNTHYFGTGLTPQIIGGYLEREPMETTFNNNIFAVVDSGAGEAGEKSDSGDGVLYNRNLWQNARPPETATDRYIRANPDFVSPGSEPTNIDMRSGRNALLGYALQSVSPAIGSGKSISNNGGIDFFGRQINDNGTKIMGAAGQGSQ